MNQPIRTVSGQPYGERKALEAAQHAVPLPNEQAQSAAAPSPAPNPPAAAPGPPALAGQNEFGRPTERPQEPVTAGLPSGPGPGPEALQATVQQQPDLIGAQLKAIFAQYPNDDLLRVMALHEQGR